jgi:hypothetical protein
VIEEVDDDGHDDDDDDFIYVQRATDLCLRPRTSQVVWGYAKLRNYNNLLLLKVPKTQEAKKTPLRVSLVPDATVLQCQYNPRKNFIP